jgi:hypothetical protein
VLAEFQQELGSGGWHTLPENPDVQVKLFRRKRLSYLLARSKPRRQKERALRRRPRRGLARALRRLREQITAGRLKSWDKILERVGRLKGRFPKARPFVAITVSQGKAAQVKWTWKVDKFKAALAADGAYLLRTNQAGWSMQEFWETYIQLTVVEKAFRVLKGELLLRPDAGACTGLRAGVCLVEDSGPLGQAGRPASHPSQTGQQAGPRSAEAAADDPGGDPACVEPDPGR